jgi:hypothetical protein
LLKNKLLRLAELIQEDFPTELHSAFKFEEQTPLQKRLDLASQAISHHQQRSTDLWLAAGNKRSPAEKKAAARADLAAFLLTYLTGNPKENAESAVEALEILGRSSETELIASLCKKRG